MVSFARCQKLFSLTWSYLFTFALFAYALGVLSKKSSPVLMSGNFIPVFSSRKKQDLISGLIFKSLIPF